MSLITGVRKGLAFRTTTYCTRAGRCTRSKPAPVQFHPQQNQHGLNSVLCGETLLPNRRTHPFTTLKLIFMTNVPIRPTFESYHT